MSLRMLFVGKLLEMLTLLEEVLLQQEKHLRRFLPSTMKVHTLSWWLRTSTKSLVTIKMLSMTTTISCNLNLITSQHWEDLQKLIWHRFTVSKPDIELVTFLLIHLSKLKKFYLILFWLFAHSTQLFLGRSFLAAICRQKCGRLCADVNNFIDTCCSPQTSFIINMETFRSRMCSCVKAQWHGCKCSGMKYFWGDTRHTLFIL